MAGMLFAGIVTAYIVFGLMWLTMVEPAREELATTKHELTKTQDRLTEARVEVQYLKAKLENIAREASADQKGLDP